MPPKGEHLSSSEIATLTTWIDQGAVWPDGIDIVTIEDRRDHWAFKPLATFQGPQSIDAFIDAKLAEKGLHRSPPADPISLIRRLSFDLTGLPPKPQEVESFTQSAIRNPESAIEHLVSSLLSSPRYGEHWAQHWLDVVRYADTHGFEVNTGVRMPGPIGYVIRALMAARPTTASSANKSWATRWVRTQPLDSS